jgi:hypothetical protein
MPRTWRGALGWVVRKSCEAHVVLGMLTMLAVAAWLAGDERLFLARALVVVMAPASITVAVATLARSLNTQAAEHEFAAWYRPPEGDSLTFREGWWIVESPASAEGGADWRGPGEGPPRSS